MLIAYHGLEADKTAILAQLRLHREADALVQGCGYWNDGKGCAVGCTLHSDQHMDYEPRFGIPVALARLEDAVFEGLSVELARHWPERFMGAIRPGQDLTRVHWHLLHWLLTTPSVNPGITHPLIADAARQCADLMADLAAGKESAESAAKSAESAAWSAASAAWSAAESAAESAAWSAAKSAENAAKSAENAAKSAESAAWSAASAAWSAASAAKSAAWSAAWSAAKSAASAAKSAKSAAWSAENAAWSAISDHLIALISAAPMAQGASKE